MKVLFILLTSLIPLFAEANTSYDWEENRKRIPLDAEKAKLKELILKQHFQYDYLFEGEEFMLYQTTHKIIYVNSSESIGQNNQIYISMNRVYELVDVKARTITKDGKVVNFDKNNLKELQDEELRGAYKIFAVEGVEVGSEIEYFYTRKMSPSIYDRLLLQGSLPTLISSFQMTSPKHLKFDFKSYNGLPSITEEQNDELNIYALEAKDLSALQKEIFAEYEPNRARLEFKLAYNLARSKARLYTWEDAAKMFVNNLTEANKTDNKELEKFVKTLGDKKNAGLFERVKNIENKLKTKIQINDESRDPALSNISFIIKNSVASEQGITKLTFQVFRLLDIQVHPVVTCSREKVRFDPAFDTWAYLDEFLLYFPEIDAFMMPSQFQMRIPVVPGEYTAQQGLFIEPLKVGDVFSGLPYFQEIPPLDYTMNMDDLDILVKFDTQLGTNNIKLKRTFGGIGASYFAYFYELISNDQKKNLVENIFKSTAPDADFSSYKGRLVQDRKVDDFEFELDFTSQHFIELANNRILFKVGELIGPQTELYREDDRNLDVENEFNRGYRRVIKVEIPDGYKIKNPEAIKIKEVYTREGNEIFGFDSNFNIEGDFLTITIDEYYKEIFAPKEDYEAFRKVINAAADFNKVVLILEKK